VINPTVTAGAAFMTRPPLPLANLWTAEAQTRSTAASPNPARRSPDLQTCSTAGPPDPQIAGPPGLQHPPDLQTAAASPASRPAASLISGLQRCRSPRQARRIGCRSKPSAQIRPPISALPEPPPQVWRDPPVPPPSNETPF
jgi:hypothetical protein